MNVLKNHEWIYYKKNSGAPNTFLGAEIKDHHYVVYPAEVSIVCTGDEDLEHFFAGFEKTKERILIRRE